MKVSARFQMLGFVPELTNRARAELAVAETQRIRAEQAVRIAKVSLAELLGTGDDLTLAPGSLIIGTPVRTVRPPAIHPSETEQAAAIGEVEARERILARSFFPKFRRTRNNLRARYWRAPGFHRCRRCEWPGPDVFQLGNRLHRKHESHRI